MISEHNVAAEIHLGLQAVQHRGQDSAGIATMNAEGTKFTVRKGMGGVTQALDTEEMNVLKGPVGVGHVRYPTIGQGSADDAQPFFYRRPGVLMAHNGNITNYEEVRAGLLERSIHLLSHCDIEPALCEFSDALNQRRPAAHTIEDAVAAVRHMQSRVRGSYSIAAALMLEGRPTLMLVRDPHAIRPAVIGSRSDGAYIVASESVALDVLGFEPLTEPQPNEIVFLRAGEAPIRRPLKSEPATPCIFEFIYFARPDSQMAEKSVYETRLALGNELAARVQDKGIKADVVIPVPDTSRPAAVTLSESLGLPLREGFIKNRYSGRTFIMADQTSRASALRLKLNTLPSEIRGRRILLVDDSIVRGNTLRRVIAALRDAGAKQVHLAIHSPPVLHPCYYGIDMSTEEELFARQFPGSLEQLETSAGSALQVDSLTYLPMKGVDRAFGNSPRCAACFEGTYPEPVPESHRLAIAQDRRCNARRDD